MMNKTRFATLLLVALILTQTLAFHPALAADRRQEEYPPPLLPTPTLAVPVEAPAASQGEPYPSGGTDFNGQLPVPIGIENGAQATEGNLANEPATPQLEESSPSDRGIIFLWLGFVATMLVFLTSVFGSIILFTRRNES